MKELGRFSSFGVRYGVFLAFVLVQIPKLWADVFITDVQNRTIRRMFDMPASFGPPFYKEGLIGFAVGAEPRGGCDLIKPPPYNLSDGLSWIAVVRRHECTFGDKVLNAEKSGYDAVIIYNVGSDDLTPMAGGSVHVDIPSCFVGADDGSAILTQFDFTSGFMVTIDNDIPLNPQYYLLPFAIVVGVCFILMVVFMVVKWVRDVRKKRKSRLSYSHLKKIPIKKFKKGDDYDVCAICLEDYEDGEKLRVLPCAHAYHSKCIDPWLLKNKKTCPVCKRKVMPGTDTDSEDEESDDSSGNNDASEITPLLSASNTPGNRGGNTFESSGLPAVFRNQVMTINTDASASEDEETVSPRTLLSLTSTAAVKQPSPGAPRADASSAENSREVSLNRKKNTVLKITNDDNRSFEADEGIISPSATTLPVNVTASASIAEECSEGAARSLPIETEVLIKNNDKEMDSKTTKANKRDNVV